ncbi:hypothetical protein HYU06_06475 [Candidatus Woesearchaeota archaeon]|nr:hypothetical protein [Candidatus Woesearchaeota archaeon]
MITFKECWLTSLNIMPDAFTMGRKKPKLDSVPIPGKDYSSEQDYLFRLGYVNLTRLFVNLCNFVHTGNGPIPDGKLKLPQGKILVSGSEDGLFYSLLAQTRLTSHTTEDQLNEIRKLAGKYGLVFVDAYNRRIRNTEKNIERVNTALSRPDRNGIEGFVTRDQMPKNDLVKIVSGDVAKLDNKTLFKDGSVSIDVLTTLQYQKKKDRIATLRRAYELLVPDGVLLISTNDTIIASGFSQAYIEVLNKLGDWRVDHPRGYTKPIFDENKQLVEQIGMQQLLDEIAEAFPDANYVTRTSDKPSLHFKDRKEVAAMLRHRVMEPSLTPFASQYYYATSHGENRKKEVFQKMLAKYVQIFGGEGHVVYDITLNYVILQKPSNKKDHNVSGLPRFLIL